MSTPVDSERIEGEGALLLVHGGAWDIPDSVLEAHRRGLDAVIGTGRRLVRDDRAAVDIVTEVVAALEGEEAFNAGFGAMLNQDGAAELDAGVMDGHALEYASVAATQHLQHPVRVARQLLDRGEGRVRMLVGEGAERFAESQGGTLVENEQLICTRERERFERLRAQSRPDHPSRSFLSGIDDVSGGDTVGSVVRTEEGHLAAATSTGGTPFKPPGRVGDSPVPGAGFLADDRVAVSTTGWGEAITTIGLARDVREHVVRGADAETAARHGVRRMGREVQTPDGRDATGGCIVVTPHEAAYAFSTPRMARAWYRSDTDESHFTV